MVSSEPILLPSSATIIKSRIISFVAPGVFQNSQNEAQKILLKRGLLNAEPSGSGSQIFRGRTVSSAKIQEKPIQPQGPNMLSLGLFIRRTVFKFPEIPPPETLRPKASSRISTDVTQTISIFRKEI